MIILLLLIVNIPIILVYYYLNKFHYKFLTLELIYKYNTLLPCITNYIVTNITYQILEQVAKDNNSDVRIIG